MVKNPGESQTFAASPDANHTVSQWSVNGQAAQSGGATFTLTNVQSDQTIRVSFRAVTYSLTASAGAGGAVSPNGTVVKNPGESQSFTAVASPNYTIAKWLMDGTVVQTGGLTFTLQKVDANHEIQVTFKNALSDSTTLVSSASLGRLRTDFDGWVGMDLTLGREAVIVTSLGRIAAPGNINVHQLSLVEAASGQIVGSSSVLMAGVAEGEFAYALLPVPVLLKPQQRYFLVSREESNGDAWHDVDSAVTTASVAVDNGGVWSDSGVKWSGFPGSGRSYGPLSFQYSTLPAGNFVAEAVPGRRRSDFSGWIGLEFRVGERPVLITSLGRMAAAHNTRVHQLKIVDATSGETLASTRVSMAAVPDGKFQYAALSEPVTLGPARRYYLVSDETSGGDAWYDVDSSIQASSSVASAEGGIWSEAGVNWFEAPGAGRSYGPVDFRYSTLPEREFISSVATGGLRTNFTGWVGMDLTVGLEPFVVTSLGRMTAAGNFEPHELSLIEADNGEAVASSTVLADGRPAGDFAYAPLIQPVVLKAQRRYFLVTSETSGGDSWYDRDSVVKTASNATDQGGVWSASGFDWFGAPGVGTTYGPLSFKFMLFPEQAFVVRVLPGRLRTNFTGWVGMDLTVGSEPVIITSLGRISAPGNTGLHELRLVESGNGRLVGSASVLMTGIAEGDFGYAALSEPVVLQARGRYYLVSEEEAGGDAWYDVDSAVQTAPVAIDNGGVWSDSGVNWSAIPAFDRSYGPLSFRYSMLPERHFLAEAVPGRPRSDFTGWVGMEFRVGENPVLVRSLGRMAAAGNTGVHSLKIVDASSGEALASTGVSMEGVPVGDFKYGAFPEPVTLGAGRNYYLVSEETSGGDAWYDVDSSVKASSSGATEEGGVWSKAGVNWFEVPGPGRSYGPVDFIFSTSDR